MPPAIAAIVSASPPNEIALRIASSQLSDSRKAMIDCGTEPWQEISKRYRSRMSASRSLRLYPNSEFKIGPDVFLARAGPRQEHGGRRRLRAANALRVVVGHFGATPRLRQDLVE